MSSPHFVRKNFNPWGKSIPDCGIRAVSAAIRASYPFVCSLFGKECRPGLGLVGKDGLSLDLVQKRLDGFFDKVQDCRDTAWENRPEEFDDFGPDDDVDMDESLGMTLDEFCEIYSGTGRYLVSLTNTEISREVNGREYGHLTFCDLSAGNSPRFFDTVDCGWMEVTSFMRVARVLPKDNPHSLDYAKG